MDKLEKYINDNLDLFNDQEPNEGHFDRFAEKLAQKKILSQEETKKTKVINMRSFYNGLKAASVIILLALSSLWIKDNVFKQKEVLLLGSVSPEYKEVEYYYVNQINNKFASLKECDNINSEKQKNELVKELKEMDEVHKQLAKELKANPNDERVINAMINHYKLKLEVMNRIINQLELLNSNNTSKNKNHESLEI